jgi:hypothetical protein
MQLHMGTGTFSSICISLLRYTQPTEQLYYMPLKLKYYINESILYSPYVHNGSETLLLL